MSILYSGINEIDEFKKYILIYYNNVTNISDIYSFRFSYLENNNDYYIVSYDYRFVFSRKYHKFEYIKISKNNFIKFLRKSKINKIINSL